MKYQICHSNIWPDHHLLPEKIHGRGELIWKLCRIYQADFLMPHLSHEKELVSAKEVDANSLLTIKKTYVVSDMKRAALLVSRLHSPLKKYYRT